MATIQNYEVPVHVDDEKHSTVFYETDKGEFDLRYGWGRYTSRLHPSLVDAKEDLLEHLQKEHPQKSFSLGTERKITEDEAKCLAPAYESRREEV